MSSLLAAFSLLTVIPVGRRDIDGRAHLPTGESAWAFPLVGLVIGMILITVDYAARFLLPPTAAAVLVVGVWVAITGGMNLDGLADSADGLLATADRERRLAIMKDSRTGAFGVVAVVMVLMAKVVFLSGLAGRVRLLALVLAPVLARTSVVAVGAAVPPAKTEGMGQAMRPGRAVGALGTVAIVVAITSLVAVGAVPRLALVQVLGVALVAIGIGRLGINRVGGYTGDILGAIIEVTEIAVLLAGGIQILR